MQEAQQKQHEEQEIRQQQAEQIKQTTTVTKAGDYIEFEEVK